MKIWAKVMIKDKILKDVVWESENESISYIKALQEICYALDIATPVSLPSHKRHFENFNRVKYLPRDFIEDADFDCLVLERVIEKKKPKTYYV